MSTIGSMGSSPLQMMQSMQEKMKAADADENGSISKEEFIAGAPEKRSAEMIDKMFERIDADGSGEISTEEQQAMLDQMAERADKISSMKSGGSSDNQIFSSLLDSLSSDDDESDRNDDLISLMKEKLASGELDQQELAQSMMEVSKMFPRINTTA